MAVAHVDLLHPSLEEGAPLPIPRRLAAVVGGVALLALAAVPGAFAVLLFIRPDLFLSR